MATLPPTVAELPDWAATGEGRGWVGVGGGRWAALPQQLPSCTHVLHVVPRLEVDGVLLGP